MAAVVHWSALLPCLAHFMQSVLSWQRARAASLLAADGRAWTDVIRQHNSGTGNNQWMVREGGWADVDGWMHTGTPGCQKHSLA